MIQYDAPVGVVERWQPELDAIAPRTESGHTWLKLVWEPGEAWSEVGRWVVYEMTPFGRQPTIVTDALLGPNPRNYGRWDGLLKRFVRTKSVGITMRQWLLFQETGCFGRPIWVVQGSRGGHKRFWTDVESNLSLMHGGPEVPPAPGDLRYAEPNRVTIDRLKAMDLVDRFGDILNRLSNNDEIRSALSRREREIAASMADQVWGWMEEQVQEAMEFTNDQLYQIWEAGSMDVPEPDYERGREEFVNEVAGSAAN